MAKMITNKARPVARFDSDIGRYILRSDGSILRQYRIDKKLDRATIVAHVNKADTDRIAATLGEAWLSPGVSNIAASIGEARQDHAAAVEIRRQWEREQGE